MQASFSRGFSADVWFLLLFVIAASWIGTCDAAPPSASSTLPGLFSPRQLKHRYCRLFIFFSLPHFLFFMNRRFSAPTGLPSTLRMLFLFFPCRFNPHFHLLLSVFFQIAMLYISSLLSLLPFFCCMFFFTLTNNTSVFLLFLLYILDFDAIFIMQG